MSPPRRQFCLNGHDTLLVGRTGGYCNACRAAYSHGYFVSHKKRYCKQRRQSRARQKRQAEIQAAKQILLSAHRLRLIGVKVVIGGRTRNKRLDNAVPL